MPEFVNTKRFRQKLATVVSETIDKQNETLITNFLEDIQEELWGFVNISSCDPGRQFTGDWQFDRW